MSARLTTTRPQVVMMACMSSAKGRALGALGAAAALLPPASEFRVARSQQRYTERWRRVPVEPGGRALLGISFRPRQAEAFGLDPRDSLKAMLGYPFEVMRLSAYWNRIEPEPGGFDTSELDWQLDAAERAGKQVIVCLGAFKTFGYPEYFVPDHRLAPPLPEGTLIAPARHPALLAAGVAHVRRWSSATRTVPPSSPGRWSTRRSTRSESSTPGVWRPSSSATKWRRYAPPTRPGPS